MRNALKKSLLSATSAWLLALALLYAAVVWPYKTDHGKTARDNASLKGEVADKVPVNPEDDDPRRRDTR